MSGCSADFSTIPVNSSKQKLYRLIGMNDRNDDGVIEEGSLWNLWREEGYRKDIDYNKDSQIEYIEALRFYFTNIGLLSFIKVDGDKADLVETKDALIAISAQYLKGELIMDDLEASLFALNVLKAGIELRDTQIRDLSFKIIKKIGDSFYSQLIKYIDGWLAEDPMADSEDAKVLREIFANVKDVPSNFIAKIRELVANYPLRIQEEVYFAAYAALLRLSKDPTDRDLLVDVLIKKVGSRHRDELFGILLEGGGNELILKCLSVGKADASLLNDYFSAIHSSSHSTPVQVRIESLSQVTKLLYLNNSHSITAVYPSDNNYPYDYSYFKSFVASKNSGGDGPAFHDKAQVIELKQPLRRQRSPDAVLIVFRRLYSALGSHRPARIKFSINNQVVIKRFTGIDSKWDFDNGDQIYSSGKYDSILIPWKGEAPKMLSVEVWQGDYGAAVLIEAVFFVYE